jgi:predicted nuclease of restriction endonuclease-like (RecB) superfamily
MSEIQPAVPAGYADFLAGLKQRIQLAQLRASLAVNRELVLLYWGIGKEILVRQKEDGWGTRVIERLSKDLRSAFPDMKGLSFRNLGYMKAFAEAWPDESILQQAAAKLPWFHNCVLIDKVKDPVVRAWYIQQAIQNGWSRNILVLQIEADLYRRQGKAITNFQQTLPAPQSDLAHQLLKDPYNFDFLTMSSDAHERELERGLLAHLQSFLLELGIGFSFIGSQYLLEVDGVDYRLDLLFYHLRLRSFVIIELKAGAFKPEYTGKMNFYLSAVDALLKHPSDQPSIGLILCKSKKRLTVEYALRNTATPMGVADFRYLEALPEGFKGNLPTVEDLEAELGSPSKGTNDDDVNTE